MIPDDQCNVVCFSSWLKKICSANIITDNLFIFQSCKIAIISERFNRSIPL